MHDIIAMLVLASMLFYGALKLIAWLLVYGMDVESLQSQNQRFTLRLWDGGYSQKPKKKDDEQRPNA